MPSDQDLQTEYTYTNWQQGIADSPELGFADMRNCNIERYPNTITPNFSTLRTNATSYSASVVRVGATNFVTWDAGSATPYVGQAVTFNISGGGITAAQVYFLTTALNLVSGTTWSSPIANTLADAFANTAVTLSSGVTGNISSINMSTIQDFVISYPIVPTTPPIVFCIDGSGRVWYQNNSGGNIATITQGVWYLIPKSDDGTTNMQSQGLTLFTGSNNKVWLFASTNTNLDVIDIDNKNTASWYYGNYSAPNLTFSGSLGGSTVFASGYFHKMLTGQDNIIYTTDGYYIASLQEIVGQNFDPTNASTYTYAARALLLPKYETAQCLEELGINLLIGGRNSNFIYPWDRSSTNFGLPLRVGEKNTVHMINISNVVYILAGVRGIIYSTTGYAVIPIKKIPEYITGGSVQWGGIAKLDGNLLFGFAGTQLDNNGNINGGVGKLFIVDQGAVPVGTLTIDQTIASGNTSTNVTALIGYQNTDVNSILTPPPFVSPLSTYYLGSSTGVDVVNLGSTRNDGSAYIVCNFEHVSPISANRSFEELGYEVEQPFSGGQSVAVQYRAALNGSFIALQTFNVTNNGNNQNDFSNGNISDVNAVQLKIILTSDGGRNPILSSIVLK